MVLVFLSLLCFSGKHKYYHYIGETPKMVKTPVAIASVQVTWISMQVVSFK